MEHRAVEETLSPSPDDDWFSEAMESYKLHAQEEHGSIVNPITGEHVDIMQQCVNLQLHDTTAWHEAATPSGQETDYEAGALSAYKEALHDFAEELTQGITAWTLQSSGEYQKGHVNRVNAEDKNAVTYDFQYTKNVLENGKQVDKVFIQKDLSRLEVKTRHLLVKGDPAGGKTTFSKQLLTWILRNEEMNWLVPVIVRTIDLVRCKESYVYDGSDIIDQHLKFCYEGQDIYRLFTQARVEGRLLIILDGFDEAYTLQQILTSQIKDVLVNECFLVVTSRDMGSTFTGPAFERFRCLRVKELSRAQQHQVIERRLGTEEHVNNFCTQLRLNPALGVMAANPLLLSVTLAVYESCGFNQEVGLNRGKVYKVALDGMLSNLEQAKASEYAMATEFNSSKLQISAHALRKVLRRIAFLAHTHENGRGKRDFKIDVVKRAIESSGAGAEFTMSHWEQIEDIIKKGRLPVLAWFVHDGVDTFRFAHLTFQEFLCAEQCLEESLKDEDFVLDWRELVCPQYVDDLMERAWWQQVLQMYCDLASSSGAKSASGQYLDTLVGESFFRLRDGEDASERNSEVCHRQEINDGNILTIVSMLRTSSVLTKMTLGTRISCQGISTFSSLKLASLQHLCLSHNHIGPEGCKSLAQFMQSSGAPLQELDLADNMICQGAPKEDMPPSSNLNPYTGHYQSHLTDLEGFSTLLEVIAEHSTLQRVDFRSNFLNLEAGRLLTNTVLANQKLQVVSGILVHEIRQGIINKIEFTNAPTFMERYSGHACPVLATGDAGVLADLLLKFPQPDLCQLTLANQALASDIEGVVQVFEKFGDVVTAAEDLEVLDLRGFWDCGVDAGVALGQKIKYHPRLQRIDIGTGSICMARIRELRQAGDGQEVHGDMLTDTRGGGIKDCGAGILSECLPPSVTKLELKGMGVGASGYKVLSRCLHLTDISGIQLKDFTDTCTVLDLSMTPTNSSGLVACVIARTTLMPNLTHLNLSHSNLTSKSHCHVLAPVIGGCTGTTCDGGCDCPRFAGTSAYAKCAECDLDFCSTCLMSECPMIALAEAVERLPRLVSLRIANCAFQGGRNGPIRSAKDEEGYKVLGAALSKHAALTELDISGNHFLGPGFPHLAKGIALMPALKMLKVGENTIDFMSWLGAESIKTDESWIDAETLILARAIARNPKLRTLELRLTGFDHDGRHLRAQVIEALVESLQVEQVARDIASGMPNEIDAACSAPRKVAVEMVRVAADSRHANPIFVEFPFGQLQDGALSSLDFEMANPPETQRIAHNSVWLQDGAYNNITAQRDLDAQLVAPLVSLLLDVSRSLKEIDFTHVEFGHRNTSMVVSSVLSLAKRGELQKYNTIPLQPCQGLKQLSLHDVDIKSHGISVMAPTTIAYGNIAELNLTNCCHSASVHTDSVRSLVNSMLRNQTVRLLDISGLPICDSGILEIANFLRVDKKLQTLRARKINAPRDMSQGVRELTSALETNITLAELDLRENPLHRSIMQSLRRTMEEQRSKVPLPTDLKYTFLLCNQHLPGDMMLPDVMCADVTNLFSDGACSPIVLIFQFCAQARTLLLDEEVQMEQRSRGGWRDDHETRYLRPRMGLRIDNETRVAWRRESPRNARRLARRLAEPPGSSESEDDF